MGQAEELLLLESIKMLQRYRIYLIPEQTSMALFMESLSLMQIIGPEVLTALITQKQALILLREDMDILQCAQTIHLSYGV